MRRALPLAAAHINALLLVMCVLPFFGMLELTALFIIRSYLLLGCFRFVSLHCHSSGSFLSASLIKFNFYFFLLIVPKVPGARAGLTSPVFSSKDVAFSSKNGKMDIMDPQWPSRKAERLSGSGRGRLNSYSPSRQTRVSPCAPVLCPLGASSRVRRHSHTRRHGVRSQKAHRKDCNFMKKK